MLDGGIDAWRDAGLPLTAEVPRPPGRADPRGRTCRRPGRARSTARSSPERLGALTLLDARAPERYRGEVEPIDPVAGHIPTAISAPTGTFLEADGRFLSTSALAVRLATLGAAGAQPVVVACGSGVNACQLALAARIAGLPDPLLYPGSYSDWSRAGMPIATGDAPGEMPAR